MKSIRVVLSGIFSAFTLASLRSSTTNAQMIDSIRSGVQAALGGQQPPNLFGEGAIFETVVELMLFIVGAVAVIMLIFGGFRYIISGGNAASVTAAKNTILYAIVGVIIAVLSYAIIDFVLLSFDGSPGGTTGL